MAVHRILDNVFNSWSHTAVLRTLINTATGFTGREIARLSGINPRTAFKALTKLEELGIVKRLRGGRDHIFTLNRKHFLVNEVVLQMFEKEAQFRNELFKDLAKILRNKVISAIVFGSTARKEETTESDLDLCCIVEKKQEIENVRAALNGSSQKLNDKFGIKLSPVFFTLAEFKKKKNTQLVKNILEEGKEITGKSKRALLNG